MDKFEGFLKIAWVAILSMFAPIEVATYVLLSFFVINFFVGFKNDKIVNGNKFSLKKAFDGAKLLIVYYAIIYLVNQALFLFDEIGLAQNATKFLTWIVCYWYLVNILRNSSEIFPEGKALKFLYDILTVQILDMILAKFGLMRPEDSPDKKR